ncbi:MAG TPA: chromate transporter [Pirellulales bacterium]
MLPSETDATAPSYRLSELVVYFLKLGAIGFGGPIALVGLMHRDLVERRGWLSHVQYKKGMALAQLAPGPLAVQLAIYLGYVHYRVWGATVAGIAFVVPSLLLVLALGWAYQHFGGLDWMQAVFYGVGASVIGIIAFHAYYLTRRTASRHALHWAIWLASAACTVIMQTEYAALFLVAGLLTMWWGDEGNYGREGSTLASWVPLAGAIDWCWDRLWATRLELVLFFAKAGAFVFGSGLAIVPFLYGGVVHDHQWLTEQQFLDAVAIAMITPGPVLITVAFIGYLIDGLSGALLTAAATFLPCYLFTVVPARYFDAHATSPRVIRFVNGVTAAAGGAICGAVVVLGRQTLLDQQGTWHGAKVIIFITTLLLLATRRVPEPLIVMGAAVVGWLIYPLASP